MCTTMGSENPPKPNRPKRGVRQRLSTEDEINRALENQKRMVEAKQLKMQTRSARPSSDGLSSEGLSSDELSSDELSSDGPSHATTISAGQSHATPSSAGSYKRNQNLDQGHRSRSKSRQMLSTEDEIHRALENQKRMFEAKQLKMQTRSAGPSSDGLSSDGPSYATTISAGQSHATPSSAGPYKRNQNQDQGHRSRSISSCVTYPNLQAQNLNAFNRPTNSYVYYRSDGPYRRSQYRDQAQRSRSQSRHNVKHNLREYKRTVNCVTCNEELSLYIYQCTNGHSSCEGCKIKMARCGTCTELITDMRNITLESTLADMTIKTEKRIKCSNAKDGCWLFFKKEEFQNHLQECPFNIISCPVMEFSGDCSWKGTINQLVAHFKDTHPKHRSAHVNKEMHLIVIALNYKVMHLVNIGFHQFLVHIQVKTSLNNIYMVTQYLGTNFSASKWSYEWHVYNKDEPRRKFEYIDSCKSNATPVAKIVNNNDCAVINMDYAKTFLDKYSKLTYKFYIKRKIDTNKNIDNF